MQRFKLNNLKRIPLFAFFCCTLLTPAIASAMDPADKGKSIAIERKNRDQGWGDSIAEMSMILHNAQGQQSKRLMQLKTLEVKDDGDKGLTIFDQPRDVKGTAFLNFSHAMRPDEQWLYLPALKRVKRISSRNKSGPFMGSEFAYEDLSSFEIEKYTYQYLKDEVVNGQACFVVEQKPTDKYSGYTRLVAWVDQKEYRPQKIEYYDRKGALLKTLTFQKYQQYLDQYWRADLLLMQNHITKKRTELITHSLKFKTGLSEKDFNKATLKRAR
ncbi:outer membrane lipoprotein-sorting protein [Algicola sagamiensis]|uniref:outer membrane lipoprotein-sorting protein n=1 Tax=Algicola sagamiensis TaxID=163869 RepID=UPI00037B36B4